MNTPKQLSDSLLAACKAAGIEKPRYIAQDKDEPYVWHYDLKPDTIESGMWTVDNGIGTKIHHQPYADDWQDSLLEWVEPQGEPLADVLARHPEHIADGSKKVENTLLYALENALDAPTGIEALVCADIAKRQQVGIAKYGTTVAENPLTHAEWLKHAYEECLDMAVYLKRAMAGKGGASE